jgi:hypothetical protein
VSNEDIADPNFNEPISAPTQPQPVPNTEPVNAPADAAPSPDVAGERPPVMVPLKALQAERIKARAIRSENAGLHERIGQLLEARLADQKIIQSLKKGHPHV